MAADFKNGHDAAKTALDHAWQWFSLHATQRLQSVNFFLVATAFLSAAFVTAAKEKMYVVAGGVAILGACLAFFLYRMERRIRSLIHASEDAIGPLQDKLAEALEIDALRIIQRVEAGKPGEWKYSKVFRYVYCATGIAFVLGLLYVAWAAVSSTPGNAAFNVVVQAVVGVFLVFCGYEMLFGLPQFAEPNRTQSAARYALLILGIFCVLAGITVLGHLVFFRL